MAESIRPNNELDPRLFAAGLRSVSLLMQRYNARPMTLYEDNHEFGICDGLDKIEGVTSETIVGKTALIKGKVDGVSYGLFFNMYDEISSPYQDVRVPMIDLRVYATSGDDYYPKDDEDVSADPRTGALRGLIWWYPNMTIMADFGHGTFSSTDPITQETLNKIISLYGLSETEIFDDENATIINYDNERLKKMIDGLYTLAHSPQVQ